MPAIRTTRLPRIALAVTFAVLAAHAAATLGAEARYGVRDETLERAPESASASRYELRAALRAGEPTPAKAGRYRAKATLGGDAVAATCGATDALFANGFESP